MKSVAAKEVLDRVFWVLEWEHTFCGDFGQDIFLRYRGHLGRWL